MLRLSMLQVDLAVGRNVTSKIQGGIINLWLVGNREHRFKRVNSSLCACVLVRMCY